MGINHRIAKLESHHGIGADADGACGHCRGRERELGKVVVVHERPDYQPIGKWDTLRPQPGPTPCPRCGRDLNTTIVVRRIDLMAKRRADAGLPAIAPPRI